MYLLTLLILSILLIVLGTAYFRINAFFVLLTVAILAGMCAGLTPENIILSVKTGFGNTMGKIGLLIIFGTTLGVILEKTGATLAMANFILRKVGQSHSPLAIGVAGFIVGLPIFCDSGFIILSSLNQSLAKKGNLKMPMMATILATSLYSVHCLIPPHPGITAAVGKFNVDIGLVMFLGVLLAIPSAVLGYFCAKPPNPRRGETIFTSPLEKGRMELNPHSGAALGILGFLLILFPISLIAFKSIILLIFNQKEMQNSLPISIISFLGEPIIALALAIVVSVVFVKKSQKPQVNAWLGEGIEKAGMVLAIIAAGGVFGEILWAGNTGEALGNFLKPLHLGIFFPFLIAVLLKTAQGSSTIAVVLASSLSLPLLEDLGLASEWGKILAVLSMGAGSMVVSHANDSYFWVIAKFSDISERETLRYYTTATFGMGVLTQCLIFLLSLIIL